LFEGGRKKIKRQREKAETEEGEETQFIFADQDSSWIRYCLSSED